MNRRTMLTVLSATAAVILPASMAAAATTKVTLEISNQTGAGFQTYVKCLGQEWSLATPAHVTTKASVDASDLILLMFEAGSHGDKKRAYSVDVPDDAGKTLTVKMVTKTDVKGVFIASFEGANIDEISPLIYLNS